MADITKCNQTLCPNASKCYRAQAPDSLWQSWSAFQYQIGVRGVECDHYIPMYETTTKNTTIQYNGKIGQSDEH